MLRGLRKGGYQGANRGCQQETGSHRGVSITETEWVGGGEVTEAVNR